MNLAKTKALEQMQEKHIEPLLAALQMQSATIGLFSLRNNTATENSNPWRCHERRYHFVWGAQKGKGVNSQPLCKLPQHLSEAASEFDRPKTVKRIRWSQESIQATLSRPRSWAASTGIAKRSEGDGKGIAKWLFISLLHYFSHASHPSPWPQTPSHQWHHHCPRQTAEQAFQPATGSVWLTVRRNRNSLPHSSLQAFGWCHMSNKELSPFRYTELYWLVSVHPYKLLVTCYNPYYVYI